MPPAKKIPLLVKKTRKATDPSKVVKVTLSSDKEPETAPVPTLIPEPEPEPRDETKQETSNPEKPKPEPEPEPEAQTKQETSAQEPESEVEPETKQTEQADDVHDIELNEPEPEIKDDKEYMTLSPEQKDELIDKLETKKHKLKKGYKQALSQNNDQAVKNFKEQLKEVARLLAAVKECDALDKAQKNKEDADKLSKDFKKKYKKLAISDFNKIIDLTAPKEERKPDISTEQIWHRSKDVIFKNKTYRKPPDDKLDKFKSKMKLKSMPKHLKKDIQNRTVNNTKAINIHQNHRDKLNYRQYDPLSYNGLNIY